MQMHLSQLSQSPFCRLLLAGGLGHSGLLLAQFLLQVGGPPPNRLQDLADLVRSAHAQGLGFGAGLGLGPGQATRFAQPVGQEGQLDDEGLQVPQCGQDLQGARTGLDGIDRSLRQPLQGLQDSSELATLLGGGGLGALQAD